MRGRIILLIIFFPLLILFSCGEINHKASGSVTIDNNFNISFCDRYKNQTKWEICANRVLTILEQQSKKWHTLFRGGHFFSAYQPVIGELLHETEDKKDAIKKHNIVVSKIMNDKQNFFKSIGK